MAKKELSKGKTNIEKLTEEEKCLIENHILRHEHIYKIGSRKCLYCGYEPKNTNIYT